MSVENPLKIVMLAVQHGIHDDRIFYKEARSLAARGHQVTILVAASKGEREEVKDLVHIKTMPTPTRLFSRLLKKVYRGPFYKHFISAARSEQADIYIAHEAQSVFIALKAAEGTHAIPVFDSHESLEFSNKKDLYALKHHIPAIQNFLAVNRMVAADILRIRPKADIQILRNASIFEASDEVHSSSFRVCFEGALTFDRGLKEMCELFIEIIVHRKLDVQFKIIGELYGAEKEYFERLLAREPMLQAVQFTGWKKYEDVHSELLGGSIGLIMNQRTPNNMYSSPNKLFNYIACNMCVLSVDLPFVTTLVQEHAAGVILDDLDPILFANEIERLFKDKDLLQSYRENSRTAHKSLSWSNESQNLIQFLERIAEIRGVH